MYPNEIIWGIDLYVIMLCVAAFSAMFVYRILADKLNMGAELQNLCLFGAVAAILVGYCSAVLFQAVYNIPQNGGFVIDSSTGATFYGGLIGGAVFFLAVYFTVGHILFKESKEHIKSFWSVAGIGAACIAIAHGFGRIGCLMAGCCYGKVTDAWYGVYMKSVGQKVVPIQVFEAIILFGLFGVFFFRVIKRKQYNLSLYMAVYGIWRFFIEYARDDYRGYTFVSFLTPSQLTALIMIAGAVVVFFVEKQFCKRNDTYYDKD